MTSDRALEQWAFLAYPVDRRYDGYSTGTVGGEPVHWSIDIRHMDRYAGALVIEFPVRGEDEIVEEVLDSALAEPMTIEQRANFWAAREARIGKVQPDGTIAWRTT
jgi:hypothetical protein